MSIRMLVVEDDPCAATALKRILQQRGCDVTAVLSVKMATHALTHSGPFDCILLDLMLPDGEGGDVIKYMNDVTTPCPFVIMTGCVDERLDRALRLGPLLTMQKPIELRNLLDLLKPGVISQTSDTLAVVG